MTRRAEIAKWSQAEKDEVVDMVFAVLRHLSFEPTCLPYPEDMARFVELRSDQRRR